MADPDDLWPDDPDDPEDLGPPPERPPSMVRAAVGFYAGMTALAFVWAGIAGRLPLWVGEPPSADSVGRWALVGVLFGLAMVIVSRLLSAIPALDEMSDIFRQILGPLTWPQAFLLAVLSGIAEELLFRGAIQPTLGLGPTCVLFAIVHWPMTPKLIPWTISAGLLGLAFGYGFELSGHVTGPVLAHFTVNFLNLKALGDDD